MDKMGNTIESKATDGGNLPLDVTGTIMNGSESDGSFIETGLGCSQSSSSSSSPSSFFRRPRSGHFFSTQDLILSAIMGVMGGIISGLIPFSLLVKTWFPLVGGTQLVSGHHLLWMAIIYGLTKKKLTIPLTAIIQGFMNFLFGSNWGILEVAITLYEGLFLIVGFFIVERFREGSTYLGWGLAGGLANLSQVPFFWYITGKIFVLHWTIFAMACMFGFLSGVVIAGILGKLIVDRIKQTGIV